MALIGVVLPAHGTEDRPAFAEADPQIEVDERDQCAETAPDPLTSSSACAPVLASRSTASVCAIAQPSLAVGIVAVGDAKLEEVRFRNGERLVDALHDLDHLVVEMAVARLDQLGHATLIGVLAVRTAGIYTIMITLAVGTALFHLAQQNYWLFNEHSGFRDVAPPSVFGVDRRNALPFYYLCLGVAALACYGVR